MKPLQPRFLISLDLHNFRIVNCHQNGAEFQRLDLFSYKSQPIRQRLGNPSLRIA